MDLARYDAWLASACGAAAQRCTHPPPPPLLPTALRLLCRPLRVDYRRGSPIAFKYVKRGYHVLCSHGLKMALMPLAAMGLVRPAACF